MKLVINTQYRENYAAHNEDFVPGVTPDYWKFKGGSTYVVPNTNYNSVGDGLIKKLSALIEYSNPASEEYILDWEFVNDNETPWPEYENPIQIFVKGSKVTALKVTNNRGEYGWMRSEILELTEAWTMLPGSERTDYSGSYLMEDGDIVEGQPGLKEWFEIKEVA